MDMLSNKSSISDGLEDEQLIIYFHDLRGLRSEGGILYDRIYQNLFFNTPTSALKPHRNKLLTE